MAFVPDDAMRRKRTVSGSAWDVYETLCAFADPYTGILESRHASNARLVEWTQLKLGTVKNALTELRKQGWTTEREGQIILQVGTFLEAARRSKKSGVPSPTNDAASPVSDDPTIQPSLTGDANTPESSPVSDAPSLYNDAPSPTNDGTYIGVTSPLTSPDQTNRPNPPPSETATVATRARDPLGDTDAVGSTSTGEGTVERGAGNAGNPSPGKAAPRKTKLESKSETPATFTPDDELLAWAREHAPGINLTLETDAFLDWNRERGHLRTREGWRHAWRNWMRNAVKFEARDGPARTNGQARAPAQGRQSNVEKSMAAVRERLAEIEVEKCQQANLIQS